MARRREQRLEEAVDSGEDLYLIVGLVDGLAEVSSVGDAVSEPGGELLHFAGRAGDLLVVEHGEVGADHVVALGLGLRVVRPGECVLLDLAEDPGIGGCGAADHDGVASRFGDHGGGVLGRPNVAVADDGNFSGVLEDSDPLPTRNELQKGNAWVESARKRSLEATNGSGKNAA